jgi:hypothetical protein
MEPKSVGITPEDVAVTLAVRDDLGPGHEPAVIAEFLDRVGSAIDERVDQRVKATRQTRGHATSYLPAASLALGIPITAIAASHGARAMAVAWAGIAVVNVADALRR